MIWLKDEEGVVLLHANCVIFREFDCPEDVLRIETKRIERPKENEVLVRMFVRPINPSDLIPIKGAYAQRITLPIF